jgi:perosamine synthetase
MTNMQAAIGVAQIKRLDAIVEKKRQIAGWYLEALDNLYNDGALMFQSEMPWAKNVYWMFSILLTGRFEPGRDEVIAMLESLGVETRPLFYPLHIMPPYKNPGDFHVAEMLGRRGLNLPSGFNLGEAEVAEICGHIEFLYNRAGV